MAVTHPRPGTKKYSCLASDNTGACVYPVDENTVRTCDILDHKKMSTLGIISSKLSDTEAIVKSSGRVDVNLIGHTGRIAYIGIDGKPVAGPPKTGVPGTKMFARPIGVVADDGVLDLNIGMTMTRFTEV